MSDKKYNGWTNYETWNVKLWIDNEEGSYNYWRERAQKVWERIDEEDRDNDFAGELAEELKSEFTENMPEVNGTYADLLGAALSEVNWYEIAETYLEDVRETA